MNFAVLLLTIFFIPLFACDPCPRKCQCHSSWLRGVTSVVVDCSKQGFKSIPTKKVSRYITSFVLNENYITELPKNAFKKYRYLKELYLYKNFLDKIHKDAFSGLRRLTELSLHSNKLKRIENGTFSHLRSLRRLYLFTNFIQEINPATFNGLRKVETVFLHENLLREIPKDTFISLERLQVLTLYRNYLQSLRGGAFNGLKKLANLYVHQNKISRMDAGVFQGCAHLLKIQLGNNNLVNVSKDHFTGVPRLVELYLDNNRIHHIKSNTFDEIPLLRKLVLLGNHIHTIERSSFQNLSELVVLSLSGNHLKYIRPGIFSGLISLKQLFLQDNRVEWIEPLSFEGMRSLQQLYLFRNQIYYIQMKTFYGLFFLSELNLGVNNITGLDDGAFLGLPRLLVLQLNSNRITTIPAGAFQKLRNLFRLVIYFNRISFLAENAFSDLRRLVSIVWYPPLQLVRTSKTLRSLRSNNLHCDCNSKWFRAWLLQRRIKTIIFCEHPSYLKGVNITGLEVKHFNRCDPLSISIKPEKNIVAQGSTLYIKCIVNNGANFSWVKNGSILPSSKSAFQTTSGILILRNVTVQHDDQYTCVATTSEGGNIAASAYVRIGTAPELIDGPEESILVRDMDETIIITCKASGVPTPLHIWFENGIPIIDGKDNKYVGYDGRLIITKFSEDDIGIYECQVRNEIGVSKRIISVRRTEDVTPKCAAKCGIGYTCVKSYSCQCSKNSLAFQCNKSNVTEEGSGDDYWKTDNEDGDADSADEGKRNDQDHLPGLPLTFGSPTIITEHPKIRNIVKTTLTPTNHRKKDNIF